MEAIQTRFWLFLFWHLKDLMTWMQFTCCHRSSFWEWHCSYTQKCWRKRMGLGCVSVCRLFWLSVSTRIPHSQVLPSISISFCIVRTVNLGFHKYRIGYNVLFYVTRFLCSLFWLLLRTHSTNSMYFDSLLSFYSSFETSRMEKGPGFALPNRYNRATAFLNVTLLVPGNCLLMSAGEDLSPKGNSPLGAARSASKSNPEASFVLRPPPEGRNDTSMRPSARTLST